MTKFNKEPCIMIKGKQTKDENKTRMRRNIN